MALDGYTSPDFDRSALVTIDVQRDVLDGGPLEIAGTSAFLPRLGALARGFRSAGRPIVHMVRLYQSDGHDVDLSRRARFDAGRPTLLAGSPGAELAPGIAEAGTDALDTVRLLEGLPQQLGPDEVVIFKPRWGAFFRTSLAEHLEMLGVNTLAFAGANFPNCPRTSIYEASERDYRLVVASDAVSGLYQRGSVELEGIGAALMTCGEIVGALVPESGPGG